MSDITKALRQICEEKGIPMETVLETVESALAAAFRKDFGKPNQNIKINFNSETGDIKAWDIKTVMERPEEDIASGHEGLEASGEAPGEDIEGESCKVRRNVGPRGKEKESVKERVSRERDEEKKEGDEKSTRVEEEEEKKPRFNPKLHLTPEEAQELKSGAKVGDEIKTELEVPGAFGRMAAQTAKQVIIQKLREAERNTLYEGFKKKEHEVMTGVVQRQEGRVVLIDLGKLTAILLPEDQIGRERYTPGLRIKVYILSVEMGPKGPEVKVSRSHADVVKELFTLEIPEIANGSVEIISVAREAGSRSKVAVYTSQENLDPVGSCIGQRGSRIQTIINELGGEKIDIIKYEEDPAKFITNALSPAKVLRVETNEEEKMVLAMVAEDQLSLAIGKAGQNVRLAAKLTGWKIDIRGEGIKESEVNPEEEKSDKERPQEDELETSAEGGSASGGKKEETNEKEIFEEEKKQKEDKDAAPQDKKKDEDEVKETKEDNS